MSLWQLMAAAKGYADAHETEEQKSRKPMSDREAEEIAALIDGD
jgi:hypothetical protein